MTRDQLLTHLVESGIAGDVATPREVNLRNYARFAQRDPALTLGLDPDDSWDAPAVLALLAERAGVSSDPGHTSGQDRIGPERTLDALDRFAEELARAAAERCTVLIGTGHPVPLLPFHAALGRALASAGCALRTPARGHRFRLHNGGGERPCALDYVQDVGVVQVYEEVSAIGTGDSGEPRVRPLPSHAHTHSPQPVRLALAALAESGEKPPDLVIGDHGWSVGAGRLGVRALALADSNDPAPFVAEAIGEVAVAVPLDDGVRSEYYTPLMTYVLQRAGLSR
jgi:hypothetical protein